MASRCTHKKQIPFPIVRRSNGDCQTGSSPGSVHRSPAPSQSAPVTSCRFAPLTVAGPRRLLPASLFNHACRRWYLFLHINFPKINFGSILRQTSAPVKRMSATGYDICLRSACAEGRLRCICFRLFVLVGRRDLLSALVFLIPHATVFRPDTRKGLPNGVGRPFPLNASCRRHPRRRAGGD